MLFTPEHLRYLLEDRNLQKIADTTGLGYATIQKLARGTQMNPTADTLQKLTRYFEARNEFITESH